MKNNEEFLQRELGSVECESIRELVLKIWSEAKCSPEYDKKKFTVLAWILEHHGLM